MKLYLVQHAEAKTKEEDPSRGLSDRGVRDVEHMSRHAERLLLKPGVIFHSGKKRALHTALILAAHLRPDRGVVETGGSAPMDDPGSWVTGCRRSMRT